MVLAIAGLIMAVVFLAVPQLQRSARDSQRKDLVSRIKSEIETYARIKGVGVGGAGGKAGVGKGYCLGLASCLKEPRSPLALRDAHFAGSSGLGERGVLKEKCQTEAIPPRRAVDENRRAEYHGG